MQGFKFTPLLHVKSLMYQRKGGYHQKNAPIRAQKKANMFEAKRLIEKVGTSYLKQVP